MSDVLVRFQALFVGGELGYGEWHPEAGGVTRKGVPAPPIAYEKHLDGHVGLGLVPVRLNGTCLFGAIDVDVDNIDHKALAAHVEELKLPLHVCRSKSGGAHLYVFMRNPLNAAILQKTLRTWSGLIGHPKAEVFPKQPRIDKTNVGSWLNLPYFGSDRTTRYHIQAGGQISGLEEFLSGICYYDPKTFAPVKSQTNQMPPCLAKITEQGVMVGQRNDTLFNVTIYHRKAFPDEWRERTAAYNSGLSSALDDRELGAILDSNAKNRYHYTCDRSPLSDFCDRAACEKLPFGVRHKAWDESGNFGSVDYANLRKITSDPPIFLLEINGKDIDLKGEQLLDFKQVRLKVMMKLNIVIPMMKPPQWDMKVQELLQEVTEIEAPEDSGLEGSVVIRFEEFLCLRKRARTEEDLIRQKIPIERNGHILFRGIDFKQYLKSIMRMDIEESQLFRWIHKRGGKHVKLKILGRDVTAWSIPVSVANEINADYTGPQFEAMKEEEM